MADETTGRPREKRAGPTAFKAQRPDRRRVLRKLGLVGGLVALTPLADAVAAPPAAQSPPPVSIIYPPDPCTCPRGHTIFSFCAANTCFRNPPNPRATESLRVRWGLDSILLGDTTFWEVISVQHGHKLEPGNRVFWVETVDVNGKLCGRAEVGLTVLP